MQTNKRGGGNVCGGLLLLSIDFFIAFYISFPLLIVALEIATSSIVAEGACLKKKKGGTNRGKDWGNRNKPGGEIRMAAAPHSLSR